VRAKFPLRLPDGSDPNGALLELEVRYMEAQVGAVVLTLFEGRNVRSKQGRAKPDPFVVFNIGDKYKKKTAIAEGGGVNPNFREERVNMCVATLLRALFAASSCCVR
jgi:Ca2+-dependent lipid-binding protein